MANRPTKPTASVSAIDIETKQKLKRKSPFSLPDNPSGRGMKPNEIKKYLYSFVVDLEKPDDVSVIGIIDNLINQISADFNAYGKYADDLIAYLDALQNANRAEDISEIEAKITALSTAISNEADTRESEVSRVEGQISAVADKVTGIESDISPLASRLQTVETKLPTLESEIEEANNQITAEAQARAKQDEEIGKQINELNANLLNYYYKKTDTYSRAQIDSLVSQLSGGGLTLEKYNALPTTGNSKVIYLIPVAGTNGNVFDEYIWFEGKWEKIGSTSVNLTDYFTKLETETLINDLLASYYTKEEADNLLAEKANNADLAAVAKSGSYADLTGKPTSLKNPYALTIGSKTYDGSAVATVTKADLGLSNVPNVNPQNAANLTSGIVPDARLSENIARKTDIPHVDTALTPNSTNPVQNKVIYNEIQNLKDSVGNGLTVIEKEFTGVEDNLYVATFTEEEFAQLGVNTVLIITGVTDLPFAVWYAGGNDSAKMYVRTAGGILTIISPSIISTDNANLMLGQYVDANIENTFTALNNFTGGLQKDGVDVATVDDVANAGGGGSANVIEVAVEYNGEEGLYIGTLTEEQASSINESTILKVTGTLYGTVFFRYTLYNIEEDVAMFSAQATGAGFMATVQSRMVIVAEIPEQIYTDNQWNGNNDFIGGLYKNGVEVATIDDLEGLGGGGSSSSGGGSVTVDSELSDTSTNPVQNKVVTAEFGKKLTTPDVPLTLIQDGNKIDNIVVSTAMTSSEMQACLQGLNLPAEGVMFISAASGGEPVPIVIGAQVEENCYLVVFMDIIAGTQGVIYVSENISSEALEAIGAQGTGWLVQDGFTLDLTELKTFLGGEVQASALANQPFLYSKPSYAANLTRLSSGEYAWEEIPEETTEIYAKWSEKSGSIEFKSSSAYNNIFKKNKTILTLEANNKTKTITKCYPVIVEPSTTSKKFIGITGKGEVVVCDIPYNTDIELIISNAITVYPTAKNIYHHDITITFSKSGTSGIQYVSLYYSINNSSSTAYSSVSAFFGDVYNKTGRYAIDGIYQSMGDSGMLYAPLVYMDVGPGADDTRFVYFANYTLNNSLLNIDLTDLISSASITDNITGV